MVMHFFLSGFLHPSRASMRGQLCRACVLIPSKRELTRCSCPAQLDAPRSATVVVLSTRAELLAVTRDDFQTVLHDLYGISVQERLLFLRSLATFQSVPTFKLEAMAHMVQAVVHLVTTWH